MTRRVLALLSVVLALGATASTAASRCGGDTAIPAAEEYAVYTAAIAYVLPQESLIAIPHRTNTTEVARAATKSVEERLDISPDTRRSFLEANRLRYSLLNKFSGPQRHVLIDDDELRAIGASADWTALPYLKATYPGAQFVLGLSRVGFGQGCRQALVALNIFGGRERASGQVVLLTKQRAGWTVTRRIPLWVA